MNELIVSSIKCWKCDNQMKVCAVKVSNENVELFPNRADANGFIYPNMFSEKEVSISRSNGVILQKRYSRTSNSWYVACCCPNCNSIFGQHYYFTKFLLYVLEGTIAVKIISV